MIIIIICEREATYLFIRIVYCLRNIVEMENESPRNNLEGMVEGKGNEYENVPGSTHLCHLYALTNVPSVIFSSKIR